VILNHLWQSSLLVFAVWVLTLVLKSNRAAVRYWLWLAASVKFLIPFSLLVRLGSLFEWRTAAPLASQPHISFVMEEMGRASVAPVAVATAAPGFNFVPLLIGIWFCGFAIGVVLWMRWWVRIRAMVRNSVDAGRRNRLPHQEDRSLWSRLGRAKRAGREPAPLAVRISSARMEPGVFGIFRPVLLLPEGIAERLTPAQLEAIVAHELCHVRRRDNLTAAIHMVVETIFWFHPLVWWIRARLIDERERACDEEVLRLGNEAEVYAEGILEACKLYLESPLACVSGVTGSDLKKRIESIMANRRSARVGVFKKVLLVGAAIGVAIGPVVVGVLNAPLGLAQSHEEFDVASVKVFKRGSRPENRKITVGHGTLTMQQQTLRECIKWAYGLTTASQITGPEWIDSEEYDVTAKAEESATQDEMRAMLRALLAERFKLAIRKTTEQRPLYSLVVAKGGPKLREVPEEVKGFHMDRDGGFMIYHMVTNLARMAEILPMFLDHPVLDKTGLTGVFDITFKVEMEPEAQMPQPGQVFRGFGMTPGIFGAVEALGLKLVSEKGPVDVLVVERVERPTGNEQAFFRKAMWSPQAFEVASVKPTAETGSGMGLNRLPGGRFVTTNTSLKTLIGFAYDVRDHQISGGPNWLASDGFDIVAKAEGGDSRTEDLRLMVQRLLADRFKLALHRETKDFSIYSLVAGKGGPKLHESEAGDMGISSGGKGRTLFKKVSMQLLAQFLSQRLGQTVVDSTGLHGQYDFSLEWVPGEGEPRKKVDGVEVPLPADSSSPSIFTALQEQLGLKLESTKGPVEILVIDRAEKPSGN
jgi:bla regulator protein BlaR1